MAESDQSGKCCSCCGQSFPRTLEYWYVRNTSVMSLRNDCKRCCNERSMRWQREHKAQFRLIQRKVAHRYHARMRTEPEYMARRRTEALAYVNKNRDAVRARARERYQSKKAQEAMST